MMLAGISMLVVALDQFTKFLVLHGLPPDQPVPLLPGYLYLTFIRNPGTAFGFLADLGPVVRIPFFLMATAAATFIVYLYQRMLPEGRNLARVALGLVWGGALGNLVDRLLYGDVIDFIDMRYHQYQWYIFNVADSCITVGLLCLLFDFISAGRKGRA